MSVPPRRLRERFLVRVGGSFGVQLAGVGIALVAHMLLARAAGEEAYGRFGTALSWATVLVLLATLGFDLSLLRFLPEHEGLREHGKTRGVLSTARRTVSITGGSIALVTIAVALAFVERLGDELAWALCVAALVVPVAALANVYQATLLGFYRVVIGQVPIQMMRPGLLFLFAAVAYATGWQPRSWHMMAAHLGAFGLVLVTLVTLASIAVPTAVRTARPEYESRHWLSVSAQLVLVSGMRVLHAQIDVIVVAGVVGTKEAGFYAIASRVARLASYGVSAATTVVGPDIARLAARSDTIALQALVGRAARVSAAASLVCAIGLVAFGPFLLGLFGEGFRVAYPVLVVLVVAQVATAVVGPVGRLLNVTGYQGAYARYFGVVTVLNLVCNVPAVFLFGIEGAAVVTGVLLAGLHVACWMRARASLGVDSSVFGRAS